MIDIVLATHNKDKRSELSKAFNSKDVNILSLEDFPHIGEIIEDGDTLRDNALIKAHTVYGITGLPSISDDTGLEVDALNGAPGVYSARYAGENCSYMDNVNKIIKTMSGVPLDLRTAQFKTVMAFVSNKMELVSEGSVKGLIAEEAKGIGGFGYDPVFYVSEMKKTFAEMTMEQKNKISHRGQATKNMIELLRSHQIIPNSQENA
jgi:XTP/dITP diphosphohydrolase